MTGAGETRVWVDDSHSIFRRGLVSCIRAGQFAVAGESSELLPQPAGFDLLVFEANAHRLRAAARLAAENRARLVAVLPPAAEHLLYEVVEAGAVAVLRRADLGPEPLLRAIDAAMGGATAIPHELMHHLLDRAARDGTNGSTGALTERELAALQLLSEGFETREIAERLCYSERTVKNIVHDLLMKTNCRNRAHVVAVASRRGLI